MNKEREYLCCIIQNKGVVPAYDVMSFYEANRYYPGLTGVVILCESKLLVVFEGSHDTVTKKFIEFTGPLNAFIQIVSSGPLIHGKRTFNSWDFAVNIKDEEGIKFITGFNQEEIPSLDRMVKGETKENSLTEFIKNFMSNEYYNYNEL